MAFGLTVPHPASVEHVLATAQLAHAELWHGVASGPARARSAARLARANGSPRALTWGLTVEAMADTFAGDPGRTGHAAEAARLALREHDFRGYVFAANWTPAFLGDYEDATHLAAVAAGRAELEAAGAPHSYRAMFAAKEAMSLLARGNWRTCADRLRFVFGANPGPFAEASARLTAALLACRQGRLGESRAHLDRADELRADWSGFRSHGFDAVRTEIATAVGDADAAVAAALDGLARKTAPDLSERLLPTAARALADDARRRRDRAADPAPPLGRLADLRRRYSVVLHACSHEPAEAVLHTMHELYDAETARAADQDGAGDRWAAAAAAARAGCQPWDETYASWRVAEALLRGRARPPEGVAALRRAYELAVDLEMAPVLSEVEAIASIAKVNLATPAPAMLAGLTKRHQEIVAHIVAGRTYDEIARALYISPKTVSSHVSAILDRTGCANRIELAQLVRRLSGSRGRPGSPAR
jgi:DNA-binding CsgD family transcriptional regulator